MDNAMFFAEKRRQFLWSVVTGEFNRRGYTVAQWVKAGFSPDDWANAPSFREAFAQERASA